MFGAGTDKVWNQATEGRKPRLSMVSPWLGSHSGAGLGLGSQGLGDPGPQIPVSNIKVHPILSWEMESAQYVSGLEKA